MPSPSNARVVGERPGLARPHLRQRLRTLTLIAERSPDIICYVDRSERLLYANPKAEEWHGFAFSAVCGLHLRQAFGEKVYAQVRERVAAALAGQEFSYGAVLRRSDGQERWIEGHYTPDLDRQGRVRGLVYFGKDITLWKQTEAEAARVESLLASFFEQSVVPMVVFNPDGVAVTANRAWERVWSQSREVLKGFSIFKDPHPTDRGTHQAFLRALAGEATQVPPVYLDPQQRGHPGRPRWFRPYFFPVKDDQGVVKQVVAINEDVTEVIDQKERLESAVRARDEFLSVASHELKTPITAVKLQFKLIERQVALGEFGAASLERLRSLLDRAGRHLDRLSSLIEDMLDTAYAATDRLHLHPEEFELGAVVEEVVERFAVQARQAGCALELSVERAVEIRGDRMRILQVLSNLLSNALKYAPGRPVRLSVSSQGGSALLSVADQGIGVAPEDRDRIFCLYEQAVPSRKFGGLGLGLYISRRIVEAHGGRIHLQSQLGQGSTFTVELPLRPAAEQGLAPLPAPGP